MTGVQTLPLWARRLPAPRDPGLPGHVLPTTPEEADSVKPLPRPHLPPFLSHLLCGCAWPGPVLNRGTAEGVR